LFVSCFIGPREGLKGEIEMMRSYFGVLLFCVLANLSVFPPALAKWSEPVLLSELNDLKLGANAFSPSISGDGKTMVFSRYELSYGQGYTFLSEARRDTPGGLFTSVRTLTEIGNQGATIWEPWLSLDGKRLYYRIVKKIASMDGRWEDIIGTAVRNDAGLWIPSRDLLELHIVTYKDDGPTLTADELTIIWTRQSPTGTVFSAVRSSIDKPFTGIREVVELSAIGAVEPHLLPDGLTVYFRAPNPKSGVPNIWKGTRAARDGVFGDFAIVSDLCDEVRRASSPYLTPDGKTIFFNSTMGTDLTKNRGIWESHWVEDPLVEARKNLQQSLAAKQAILGQIDAAVAQEREAMDTLKFLWQQGGYQGLTPNDLYQSFGQTSLAVSRQLLARRLLDQSIVALQSALDWLKPKPAAPRP
jgi:hypothetical protein